MSLPLTGAGPKPIDGPMITDAFVETDQILSVNFDRDVDCTSTTGWSVKINGASVVVVSALASDTPTASVRIDPTGTLFNPGDVVTVSYAGGGDLVSATGAVRADPFTDVEAFNGL